jgi:hypothetical protein
MFSACSVCGLAIAQGHKCLICDAEEKGEAVKVMQSPSGLVVAWWTGDDPMGLEASATLTAKDFAQLVRAQRGMI